MNPLYKHRRTVTGITAWGALAYVGIASAGYWTTEAAEHELIPLGAPMAFSGVVALSTSVTTVKYVPASWSVPLDQLPNPMGDDTIKAAPPAVSAVAQDA